MFSNQPGSRRWTHFHSALQLAIQRSARKWTLEDFSECFPLYYEEEKNGASGTFSTISDYIETQNFKDLDKLFKEYNMQDSIDTLHRIVTEAKERKAKGTQTSDVWKDSLDPRVAVAARTVPKLGSEVARLKALIAKEEDETRQLETELQEQVQSGDEANDRAVDILRNFEEIYHQWQGMTLEEIEDWTVQTVGSLKPIFHS